MIANTYREYVTHPSIPGGEADIGMPGPRRAKSMTLCASAEWARTFRNRAACIRWMVRTMPDALVWATNNGVTECAGSVRGLAERAGLAVPA